jgi:hypothetical protein
LSISFSRFCRYAARELSSPAIVSIRDVTHAIYVAYGDFDFLNFSDFSGSSDFSMSRFSQVQQVSQQPRGLRHIVAAPGNKSFLNPCWIP